MSQVSRGDLSFLDPSVDHVIDLVEALAQFGVVQYLDGNDLREAGSQDSVICASAQLGGAPAQPRHPVTVSSRSSVTPSRWRDRTRAASIPPRLPPTTTSCRRRGTVKRRATSK